MARRGSSSGVWFRWNTTAAAPGGQTITRTGVPLAEMVFYVRAGAIVPLQRAAVQHTDQIGGELTVQVYGGCDAVFEMVEDDGITLDYRAAAAPKAAATRVTTWRWDDAAKTLTWSVRGVYAGPSVYTSVQPVLFVANATAGPRSAPAQRLTQAGGKCVFR